MAIGPWPFAALSRHYGRPLASSSTGAAGGSAPPPEPAPSLSPSLQDAAAAEGISRRRLRQSGTITQSVGPTTLASSSPGGSPAVATGSTGPSPPSHLFAGAMSKSAVRSLSRACWAELFAPHGAALEGWTLTLTPASPSPDGTKGPSSYTFGPGASIARGGWLLLVAASPPPNATSPDRGVSGAAPPDAWRPQIPASDVLAKAGGFDTSTVVDFASGPQGGWSAASLGADADVVASAPAAAGRRPAAAFAPQQQQLLATTLAFPPWGGLAVLTRPDGSVAANVSFPRMLPGLTYGVAGFAGAADILFAAPPPPPSSPADDGADASSSADAPPRVEAVEYTWLAWATPGAINARALSPADGMPRIGHVTELPVPLLDPSSDQRITAIAGPVLGGIAPEVTLHYQLMFGPVSLVRMLPTGAAVPGGGASPASALAEYAAAIPAGAGTGLGQMTRYFVEAAYPDGTGETARIPALGSRSGPPFFGTFAEDPGIPPAARTLPRLYLFCKDDAALKTKVGATCSLAFQGAFHDSARVHRRGDSTLWWPKPKLTVKAAKGGRLITYAHGQRPSADLDLHSEYEEVGRRGAGLAVGDIPPVAAASLTPFLSAFSLPPFPPPHP